MEQPCGVRILHNEVPVVGQLVQRGLAAESHMWCVLFVVLTPGTVVDVKVDIGGWS